MSRQTHPKPSAAELRAAAWGATLNHAARLLRSTDSPAHRDLARALLRVRDSLAGDPDCCDEPRPDGHRAARIPKIDTAPIDAGPLLGELVLPVAPAGNGWLRPLRRYYELALAVARTESDATTALMRLDALRCEFQWDADFFAWRRMAVTAGACASVEVLTLRLSAALGAAALKATQQSE